WFVEAGADVEAMLQELQQYGPRPRHVLIDALDPGVSYRAGLDDDIWSTPFDGVIWTGAYGNASALDAESFSRDLVRRLDEFVALRERMAGIAPPDFV